MAGADGRPAIYRTLRWPLLLLSLCCAAAAEAAQTGTGKRVLVFGGNGFIGSATVDRLLADGVNVTLVNRGNSYWDSRERFAARVTQVDCDRQNGLRSCRPLAALINTTQRFDAVVDFSAYDGNATRESTSLLKGKVGVYVLVSTDSVYDVCEKAHEGGSVEADAARPEADGVRESLAAQHPYGDGKLSAEEHLRSSGVPFAVLRLPDVFGPRDTSYRWWVYQLWLRVSHRLPDRPVTVPRFLAEYPISFVYVDDVARVIADVVSGEAAALVGDVVNLAYAQPTLLPTLLEDIRRELGSETPPKQVDDSSGAAAHFYLYPSTHRGPVDVSKAQRLLGWTPTPWAQAVATTVAFYERAAADEATARQRDEVVQIVGNQVYSDDRTAFYDAFERIYSVDLKHFKHPARDEL